jgi:hypothetical protein
MGSIETGSVSSTAVVEASESGLRTIVRANPVGVAAVLAGATLVSWIVAIERMRGMDMGPGTGLGAVGWYVGLWVTMMSAMMLPSVAPMVLVFSRIGRERARRGRDAHRWVDDLQAAPDTRRVRRALKGLQTSQRMQNPDEIRLTRCPCRASSPSLKRPTNVHHRPRHPATAIEQADRVFAAVAGAGGNDVKSNGGHSVLQ